LKHEAEPGLLVTALDEYGRTPLRLACELSLQLPVIRLLLDAFDAFAKGDADVKREALVSADRLLGFSPLHAFADSPTAGQDALTELLARGGSEVLECRDARNRTPLHIAALASATAEGSIYELLVSAGADVDALDEAGRTALELAHSTTSVLRDRRGPTIILHNDVCMEHLTCPLQHTDMANINAHNVPPENVNRLHVLLDEGSGTLWSSRLQKSGLTFVEAPKVFFYTYLHYYLAFPRARENKKC